MSTHKVPSKARQAYKFIESHRNEFSIQMMCRLLGVARAGYYAWLDHPVSDRSQEDARLLRLIRASFTASHGIYGAPRVFQDLRERGETCSGNPPVFSSRQKWSYAAIANFCIGVMPPSAMFGRSWL